MSPDTLLRLIRRAAVPTPPPVRVCGVDNFAWRKRRRYGTALVDREWHRRIDILPERSAASVATWLRHRPASTVVRRDRGGEYAHEGHLGHRRRPRWRNVSTCHTLGDVVRRVLSRHAALVRRVQRAGGQSVADHAAARARTQMANYFAAIHAAARGLSTSAIARALGVHRHTVRQYLALDAVPERRHAKRHVSILAPYAAHRRERWRQGSRDARALWRELPGTG